MQIRRGVQSLHRWLGLALGAQLVIWTLSGVVMSLLPIGHVRGENMVAYEAAPELKVQNYFPPAGVLAEVEGAREATLKSWLGREVYIVTGTAGDTMFDADTGERISPISEQLARQAALQDFAGEDTVERATLLNRAPREAGGGGPIWRIEFSDPDRTRLYISPGNGKVVARRNRIWRFYDFFWMLHIMDYEERENFNNPLVRIFAVTGLMFALSGLALVVFRLQSGRYVDDTRRATKSAGGAKEKAAE
ncbi:MAG: hypothetical protein A3E78_10115 [Alphaproteobacteria bacterium RIFCSPHIGHO2_12_FULL_63_12]|nr:MAG: hypothetical protein A3E78_10115 [Alphaproteobacteria bacterium RIFCSPHIGHO2_12_FULL_63_12]